MTLKPWPTTLTDSCFYLTNMAVNIWTGIWTIWSKVSLHGASWNKCTRALTHKTEGWIENDSHFKLILSWYSFFFLTLKISFYKKCFCYYLFALYFSAFSLLSKTLIPIFFLNCFQCLLYCIYFELAYILALGFCFFYYTHIYILNAPKNNNTWTAWIMVS